MAGPRAAGRLIRNRLIRRTIRDLGRLIRRGLAPGRPVHVEVIGLIRHDNAFTQFRSSSAPASPDFSGWNWVTLSGPCSTAATKSSPWWAQLTIGDGSGGESAHVQRRTA